MTFIHIPSLRVAIPSISGDLPHQHTHTNTLTVHLYPKHLCMTLNTKTKTHTKINNTVNDYIKDLNTYKDEDFTIMH